MKAAWVNVFPEDEVESPIDANTPISSDVPDGIDVEDFALVPERSIVHRKAADSLDGQFHRVEAIMYQSSNGSGSNGMDTSSSSEDFASLFASTELCDEKWSNEEQVNGTLGVVLQCRDGTLPPIDGYISSGQNEGSKMDEDLGATEEDYGHFFDPCTDTNHMKRTGSRSLPHQLPPHPPSKLRHIGRTERWRASTSP